MLKLNLKGTHEELWAELEKHHPGVRSEIGRIHATLREHYPKRETRDYEAALLFVVARQYDNPGSVIAEIGTCWGWTAAVMQAAAPNAHIMTTTPNPNHVIIAKRNLIRSFPNIEVLPYMSVDWLPMIPDDSLDMVFVDGDHKRVSLDLPFYNKLKVGGLKIHHDYCPEWSTGGRPCRPVYAALNDFAERTHKMDVLMVDDTEEGLAGWYRRRGEVWNG